MKDPSLLPPLPVVRDTKSFTDGTAPGEEWSFTFEIQEGVAPLMFLSEKTEELFAQFGPGGEPITAPGNVRIPVSRRLCEDVAAFMMMDRSDYGEEAQWNFRHWAVFAQRCCRAFVQVREWADGLTERAVADTINDASGGGTLKNGSAADADI